MPFLGLIYGLLFIFFFIFAYLLSHPVEAMKYLITLPFTPKKKIKLMDAYGFNNSKILDKNFIDLMEDYLEKEGIKYKMIVEVPFSGFECESLTEFKIY